MAMQRIEWIACALALAAVVLTSCGAGTGSPAMTGTVERGSMSRLQMIDEAFYPTTIEAASTGSPSRLQQVNELFYPAVPVVEDCRGRPC